MRRPCRCAAHANHAALAASAPTPPHQHCHMCARGGWTSASWLHRRTAPSQASGALNVLRNPRVIVASTQHGWVAFKHVLNQFRVGTKLLYADMKTAGTITSRVLQGPWSRNLTNASVALDFGRMNPMFSRYQTVLLFRNPPEISGKLRLSVASSPRVLAACARRVLAACSPRARRVLAACPPRAPRPSCHAHWLDCAVQPPSRAGLAWESAGHMLSRRERNLLVRTVTDMMRLVRIPICPMCAALVSVRVSSPSASGCASALPSRRCPCRCLC